MRLSSAPKSALKIVEFEKQDVAQAFAFWRNPETDVEFAVAGFRKRMRPREIDWLLRKNPRAVVSRERVVRHVHVEVEGIDAREPAGRVCVTIDEKRHRLVRPGDRRRPQAVAVLDREAEPLDDPLRITAEALLTRHQRITVMGVLHRAHLQIVRYADIVMRADNQATAFAREECRERFDLGGRGLLACDIVIETEDEQRVGVSQDALIDGQAVTGMIDTLE